MSYETALAGLHECFRRVPRIQAILDYEPTSIQAWPTLYSLFDGAEFARRGQVKSTTYRTLHRLVFLWQDNERAEEEMIPYIDLIPAVVAADPHLSGALASGLATIDSVNAVWVTIAGVQCRALDFYSTVVEKG